MTETTARHAAPVASRGTVRVGVDVVSIPDVEASMARFGARYVDRLFTAHEQSVAAGPEAVRAARLAARFAAKEATVKVLRPTGANPPWRDIEVRSAPDGSTSLALGGAAAALAADAGVRDLAVSLSHEGGAACAVVVAMLDEEGESDA
jgi:holo-[acyl-carrier protein] synthase